MREIKFRGMDLQGRWFYGNLAVIPKDTRDIKAGHCISNSAGMPFAYRVRPETVGQYTGLKDNKGEEVYEGDICQKEDVVYEIRWVENAAKWGAKVIKSKGVLVRGLTFRLQDYVKEGTLVCTFEKVGTIYDLAVMDS